MSLSWIDIHVDGVIDYCYSRDIFEIYNSLNIDIVRTSKDSFILQGNEAIYIRNYFDMEIVFIRDNLPYKYEKFLLAHELGHAVLHTEIAEAAFNNQLTNKGKLEHQADYFAIKLLGVKVDGVRCEGLSIDEVANDLCVSEDSLEYVV